MFRNLPHSRLCLLFLLSLATLNSQAQEETGRASAPATSWTMLSVHRVWSPQYNGFPNGGFGVQSFFSMGTSRNPWLGFSVIGTGLHKRDALAIDAGLGTWFVGDSRLGGFCFAMTGLGMTSGSGLTGFDFFSDNTLSYGLASQGGVGGCVELFTNIKLHVTAFGMWFTNDGGPTPYGLQLGLTFGGK